MKLLLQRIEYGRTWTGGELYVDGILECVTLEDKVREITNLADKVPHETAIPAGTYKIAVNMSSRFKRYLPILLNVPYFTGIRIHPGNSDGDTEGCILVGEFRRGGILGNSRTAFNALWEKIIAAWDDMEPITIEIVDKMPEAA